MGSARYVGRVGALAVAMGVGVAVALSPGVACATPESGTETGSSSDTGPDTSPGQQDSPDTEPDAQSDESEAEPEPEADDVDPEADELDSDDEVEPEDEDPDLETDPDDDDETQDQDIDEVDDLDAGAELEELDTATPGRDEEPEPLPAVEPTQPTEVERQAHRSAVVEAPAVSAELAARPQTVSLFSAAAPEPVVAQLTPTNPVAAFVAAPLSLVSTLVGAALSPFLAPGPTAPAQAPVLWAVLAWVRREINRTFFNQSPTLVDNQDSTEVDDDTVAGTVTGTDPDDDTLTYRASGGQPGATIIVDADGNWTYTAPESWDGADEYTDTFDITVTDQNSRPHWHGLLGFLKPPTVHQDTVTVHVSIPSNVAEQPRISSVRVGPIDESTGAVTHYVEVRDSDGDDIPPTLTASQPEGGTGTISTPRYLESSSPGVYFYEVVYTPSPEARLAAYSTPGEDTDFYSLTASDSDPRNEDTITRVRLAIIPAGAVATGSGTWRIPDGVTMVSASLGDDGSLLVLGRTGSGTAADPYQLVTTVLRPDGTADTVPVENAGLYVPPQLMDDGSIYYTTRTGQNTVADPAVDSVTILRPGQQPQTYVLPGVLSGAPVAGPDGTLAVTTFGGTGTAADPYRTNLTVLRPGEDPVVVQTAETPSGVVIGADGTVVYSIQSGGVTTVTVLRKGQPAVNQVVSSPPIDAVMGADGTVTLVIATIPSTPGGTPTYTLTVLRPNKPAVSQNLTAALASGIVVADDGTVSVITANSSGHTVTVLRPDQATPETLALPASPLSPQQTAGADGTIAVVRLELQSDGNYTPRLTVLRPGQAPQTVTAVGAAEKPPVVGDDGTVALVTRTVTGPIPIPGIGDENTTVTVVRPGENSVSTTVPGSGHSTVITDDGTVYAAVRSVGKTTVVVLRPGETTAHTVAIAGEPLAMYVGPDGAVYVRTQTATGVPGDELAVTTSVIALADTTASAPVAV